MINKDMKSKILLTDISKFSLICSFLFIFFTIFARFILPFGDEPDFNFRLYDLLDSDDSIFSPYFYVKDFLSTFAGMNLCPIHSTATSLWAHIDFTHCRESIMQIIGRIFLTILIFFPVLFFICFRGFSYFIVNIFCKNKFSEIVFNKKLDAVSIALIFPSFIYLSGILAQEQLLLSLAIIMIIFIENWFIIVFLLGIMASIDVGNTTVYLTFCLIYYFLKYIDKNFGRKYVLIFSFSIVIFAFVVGGLILNYVSEFSLLADRAEAMQYKIENAFVDKYPKYVRPLITFSSAVFMSSESIKVIILYIILLPSLFFGYLKLSKISNDDYASFFKLQAIISLTTILFFIFLFPDYSYVKYYIFLLPLFISIFLVVYSKFKVLIFVSLLTIIWLINLLAYML